MSDSSSIHFNPVHKDLGNNKQNSFEQKLKANPNNEKAPVQFHNGEIVRGVIIEKYDDNFAKIKIPSGSFSAYIEGNLRVGDSLLFKVKETIPKLILKVHEVSKNQNNIQLSINEILRILDIPSDKISKTIIDVILQKRNNVNRELVFNILASFNKGLNLFDIKNMKQILETIFELEEANLPQHPKLINRLHHLFQDLESLSSNFEELIDENANLPVSIKESLKKLLFDNQQNMIFSDLLSISSNNSNTLINILFAINELEPRAEYKKYKIIADNLINFMDSMSIWNLFAAENKAIAYLLIPFLVDNKISLSKVAVKKIEEVNSSQKKYFSIYSKYENLGEVSCQYLTEEDKIEMHFLLVSESAKKTISENILILNEKLRINGYKVHNIKFAISHQTFSNPQSDTNKNLTIVV